MGIDEDTALRLERDIARAIDSGGGMIIDASRASHSNAAGAHAGDILWLNGATLPALGSRDGFDPAARPAVR